MPGSLWIPSWQAILHELLSVIRLISRMLLHLRNAPQHRPRRFLISSFSSACLLFLCEAVAPAVNLFAVSGSHSFNDNALDFDLLPSPSFLHTTSIWRRLVEPSLQLVAQLMNPQFLNTFTALIALFASSVLAVSPLVVKGADFVNSVDNSRFQIIGVA